jgi:hypothetical protein
MITAKDAVNKAANYLQSLIPLQVGRTPVLEELEKSGSDWLVTLSYVPQSTNLDGLAMPGTEKEYKIFRVEGTTGEILSMKIRTLK